MTANIPEEIRYQDCYRWDDLFPRLPNGAESLYDISIGTYGSMQDAGTYVVLSRTDGEPEGWDTAREDLSEAAGYCQESWGLAEFSYQG